VPPIIQIENLSKTYKGGFQALKSIHLAIEAGEIFALLGPNGAGKTTLINIVCGIVNPGGGSVRVDGYDIITEFRKTRALIGLVPQEMATESFETVLRTVTFSRGLFGKPPNPDHIEKVLRSLSLWNKRNSNIMTLSGGMKRRVLIAKALAHEPTVLFLDEPTAGVDVELRKDMWNVVRALRDSGVTIILTTHYIEEAEQIADRIGIIDDGEIILVQEKRELMKQLGKKRLVLELQDPISDVPAQLSRYALERNEAGTELTYSYNAQAMTSSMSQFLREIGEAGIGIQDVRTMHSSLEDIFIDIVRREP
jgi:ABC-2 type transport system ATP-binding protein